MKVAFYSTSAEDHFRYRLPVARQLREAGYTVVFVGPGGEYAARTEEDGFTYRRLAISFEGMPALGNLAAGFQLAGIYRRERPDIVHHFTLHGLLRGAIAARFGGVEWVTQSLPPLSDHNGSSRLLRGTGRNFLRFALRDAEVTFRTHEDRQLLINMGCVRPERTCIISSSGIDLSLHPYVEEPERTPVVAMIGAMADSEAIHAFADAATQFRTRDLPARFVLISTKNATPAVPRARLDSWQEEGLLEWWGRRRDEVHALEVVHVVCMLERFEGEMPYLLLESAAAGRPIVTLDDPAVRMLVREDTGRLVPRHDAAALVEAVEPLLRDEELRRCLGKNARRLVESEFSAERVAQQTMSVYERLFLKGRDV